jgi:predicted HNH restriction endonuclease
MRWTKEEIEFLKENYSKVKHISEISKSLNKSAKAINHKAARISISRPRFPSDKPTNRQPRIVIEKRYYEKNKEKIYQQKMGRRKRLKEEAVKIAGEKCKVCGYNKCISALEFHHNQSNKEGNVSTLLKNGSRQKLLKEAEKCILLCANCHRELHNKGL